MECQEIGINAFYDKYQKDIGKIDKIFLPIYGVANSHFRNVVDEAKEEVRGLMKEIRGME